MVSLLDGIEPPTHGLQSIALPTFFTGKNCGGRIWRPDLRVMNPTTASTPSRVNNKIRRMARFRPTHAFTWRFSDRSLQPDLGNLHHSMDSGAWTTTRLWAGNLALTRSTGMFLAAKDRPDLRVWDRTSSQLSYTLIYREKTGFEHRLLWSPNQVYQLSYFPISV